MFAKIICSIAAVWLIASAVYLFGCERRFSKSEKLWHFVSEVGWATAFVCIFIGRSTTLLLTGFLVGFGGMWLVSRAAAERIRQQIAEDVRLERPLD